MINNTHASFGNLMTWVLDAFDLEEPNPENAKKLRKFTEFVMDQYSDGKRVLLVIDEAQNLSEETLKNCGLSPISIFPTMSFAANTYWPARTD